MKRKLFKSTLLNIIVCSMLLIVWTLQNLKAQDEVVIFDVGSLTVTLLQEGQGEGATNILVGATDEMIQKAIPDGTYPIATNVFLVEMGTKSLLFDAGYGQKTIDNLALCGKSAGSIDAVFISHFHGDHIGSLLLNGQQSFPNASLYISKPEYDYYMNDTEMTALPENRRGAFTTARNIFNAYKDKLVIFTPGDIENATELMPGVKGVAAYGHTPGHVGYLLESDGAKLFYWGDLTHAMAIQMPFPQVAMTYDTDPVKAVEIRKQLLQYIADNQILVAGAHIEYPGIGDLIKITPDSYEFVLMCSCSARYP